MAPVPGHARSQATAWALSLLTTLASVVFAVGAIAGWIMELWPATPVTLGAAAVFVLGGPLTAFGLRAAMRSPAPPPPAAPAPAPVRHAAPRPAAPVLLQRPLTPDQAWGRELLAWRSRARRR